MKKITLEQLYERQTTLKEIGEAGQQKLLQAKVTIVGCGGLGSAVAVYLSASGIGEIHLVDYDLVAVSNLHRQVFYTTNDVGKPKVEMLAKHIESISPFVKVSYANNAVSKSNIFGIIVKADIIIDCTDSLATKYLLNDACVLKDKPLIYGSLYKFDGYVASFNVKIPDNEFSANLRDAFPEISKEAIPNCSEIGTLNAIVGIIGLMQANEVLKLVTGVGKPIINELLIYNSLENSQYKMKLKSLDSSHSERKQRISEIFETETYYDANCDPNISSSQDETLLISAKALHEILEKNDTPKVSSRGQNSSLGGNAGRTKRIKIVSVIENTDTPLPFDVDAKIPLSKLDDLTCHIELSRNIDIDSTYIIVCNKGISSYAATLQLKEVYPNLNVLSLKDGITNY